MQSGPHLVNRTRGASDTRMLSAGVLVLIHTINADPQISDADFLQQEVEACFTHKRSVNQRVVLSLEDLARVAHCALLGLGGFPVPTWSSLPPVLRGLAHSFTLNHSIYRHLLLAKSEEQLVWGVDLLLPVPTPPWSADLLASPLTTVQWTL